MSDCGIYILYFSGDNRVYIGKSKNITKRYNTHCLELARRTHHCKKLQEAYDTYNILPSIEVLELCSTGSLNVKEIWYIEEFDSYKSGFNATKGGDDPPALVGENHPQALYGKDVYINIYIDLARSDLTQKEIAKKHGVGLHIVKDICRGATHTYLKDEYPEVCEEIHSKRVYVDLVAPNGTVHSGISNLRQFCMVNGLQAANIHKVINGERTHHKGWKLKE